MKMYRALHDKAVRSGGFVSPLRAGIWGPICLALTLALLCAFPVRAQIEEDVKGLRHRVDRLEALVAELQAWILVSDDPIQVNVDCGAGQTVADALLQGKGKTGLLDVTISGFCQENIVIDRNNVILHGSNPETDGILGVPGIQQPVVKVTNAHSLVFENLTVGSGLSGLWLENAETVLVTNCRFTNNQHDGFRASHSSVRLVDTTLTDNGSGLIVADRSIVFPSGCTIQDNFYYGAWAGHYSWLRLQDSLISGGKWGFTASHAKVGLQKSTVSGTEIGVDLWYSNLQGQDSKIFSDARSISVKQSSRFGLHDSELKGAIHSDSSGFIQLVRVSQTELYDWSPYPGAPSGNYIGADCFVRISEGSTILGPTYLWGFSKAYIIGLLDGDVFCGEACDAYCPDATHVTGTASGCEHCIVP